MTKTVATLGPSVRLIVFKFLIKSNYVPDYIPRLPINRSGVMPAVRGQEVLPSTPTVYLGGVVREFFSSSGSGNYKFVGARVADEERDDGRNDVRFTFCHRQHLNSSPSHPNFKKMLTKLREALRRMTEDNVWSVQTYLNPYLLENGKACRGKVLMLNCNSRRQVVNPDGSEMMIWATHDELGRGIGPKMSLLSTAGEITLDVDEKSVVYSSVR